VERRLNSIEREMEGVVRRRKQRRFAIGLLISLGLHACLMWYLNNVHRAGTPGIGDGSGSYQTVAILQEEELLPDSPAQLEDLSPGVISTVEVSAAPSGADVLQASVPTAAIDLGGAGASGSLAGVGGGGSGGGMGEGGLGGGGGGGGGTSFFGVSSKGTRFAYVVDVSGSMAEANKMRVALRELARSVESLPDYSYFYVTLFSSGFRTPPMQDGWVRARKPVVRSFIRWLNDVDPGGGTYPHDAFVNVFSLDVRPDVIFFLTDGELQDFSAEELADMNSRGRRVVVNTIGFGEEGEQESLRQMAADSGGVYRFVPTVEQP